MTETKVPGTKIWYNIQDRPDKIMYIRSGAVGKGGVITIQKIPGTPKIIPGSKTKYVVSISPRYSIESRHIKRMKQTNKTFHKKTDAKAYAKKLMKQNPGKEM